MPRYATRHSDSETDYSETDVSIDAPRRRTVLRRRSVSRRRLSPDVSPTFLAPVPPEAARVVRSASTSGRRRLREDPPAVIVDIRNDVRTKNANAKDKLSGEVYESEGEVIRSHRRPRRGVGASRESSPRVRDRDFELLLDQRLLEKNDVRQDIELVKMQQEITRLEAELARKRERQDYLLLKEDEDLYEEEINERLRKLERLERKQRAEEERRKAEYRSKMQKYEEQERLNAEKEELKKKLREEKLKKLEEEEKKERLKQELRDEEARQLLEQMERQKAEQKLKMAAIEEYKLKEAQRIEEEQKLKKQKDKEFKDRLIGLGYTEEQVEVIIKGKKVEEKKEVVKEEKTTWIKVHRKHLLPETLIAYRLPWDWDEHDSNYIIIKQWINEDFQEELFAHTRRLREGKLVTQTSSSLTELKVRDKRKDNLYLVRKKSPNRRSWIFT